MARSDDLAPLLAPGRAPAVGIRQGAVISWDPVTLNNEIEVAEAILVDLPVLNVGNTNLIVPGDAVMILTYGSSWLVLGRVIVPS